jgi:hypothetical protein
MKEDEWLACNDPRRLLDFLRGRASDRKRHLFTCACCRRVWHLLADQRSRQAVEVGERYADGRATRADLLAARAAARAGFGAAAGGVAQMAAGIAGCATFLDRDPADTVTGPAAACVASAAGVSGPAIHPSVSPAWVAARDAEYAAQVALLRDLFGNPFRPVTTKPDWLTPTVVAVARAAYDERHPECGALDNARLGVLADALEEAGCSEPTMLAHLRGPGPHARGCWVVDALLGLC